MLGCPCLICSERTSKTCLGLDEANDSKEKNLYVELLIDLLVTIVTLMTWNAF